MVEVDRAGVKQAELVSTPLPFPGTQPTPSAGESLSLSLSLYLSLPLSLSLWSGPLSHFLAHEQPHQLVVSGDK